MSFGVFDYAKQNPTAQEPPQEAQTIREAAQDYKDQQERKEDIDRLKTSILRQLEQGHAPQLILYTAIRAIGAATADQAFTDQAEACLDLIYGDLMQESFIMDNAATAAARLDDQMRKYIDGNRRRLGYMRGRLGEIQQAIDQAAAALDCLEIPPDPRNLDASGSPKRK